MPKKNFPKTYEPATIALFEHKMEEAGYTPTRSGQHEAFLCALLQTDTTPTTPTLEDFLALLDIRSEDHAAIMAMLKETGADMGSVLSRIILAELQRYQSRQQRLAELDLSDPENRQRRAGAGYAYLQDVLQAMMQENLTAREWYERRYITAERLAKRAGSNPRLCRQFLQERTNTLHEHHTAMGWKSVEEGNSHNHRAGNVQRDMARQARKAVHNEQAILADLADVG